MPVQGVPLSIAAQSWWVRSPDAILASLKDCWKLRPGLPAEAVPAGRPLGYAPEGKHIMLNHSLVKPDAIKTRQYSQLHGMT